MQTLQALPLGSDRSAEPDAFYTITNAKLTLLTLDDELAEEQPTRCIP